MPWGSSKSAEHGSGALGANAWVHAGVWETARVPSADSLDSTPSFEVTQQPQAVKKSRGNDQISDKSEGTVPSSSETAIA